MMVLDEFIAGAYGRYLAMQMDADFMEMLRKGYEINDLQIYEMQSHPETWYIGLRNEPVDMTKMVDHGSMQDFIKFIREG